jgi:DNA-binding MarR family transcriptional regulator
LTSASTSDAAGAVQPTHDGHEDRRGDASRPARDDAIGWAAHYWDSDELGDPSRFLAAMSLLRSHQRVASALERTLKPLEIGRTAYLVLMTLLLSEDGSRSISVLSAQVMVHPTTMTQLTAQLETSGLIRKQPHPTDGRTTLALITPAGKAIAREGTRELERSSFGLDHLGDDEVRTLTDLLRDRTPEHRAAPAGTGDPT